MLRRLCALMLISCAGSMPQLASAQEGGEKRQEMFIVDGVLPQGQRLIKVQQGERLRWRITSNAPGELHLHAYRLSVAVPADKPAELAFTAFATGRFRLEWHGGRDKRPASGAHHAPALAILEVRPN